MQTMLDRIQESSPQSVPIARWSRFSSRFFHWITIYTFTGTYFRISNILSNLIDSRKKAVLKSSFFLCMHGILFHETNINIYIYKYYSICVMYCLLALSLHNFFIIIIIIVSISNRSEINFEQISFVLLWYWRYVHKFHQKLKKLKSFNWFGKFLKSTLRKIVHARTRMHAKRVYHREKIREIRKLDKFLTFSLNPPKTLKFWFTIKVVVNNTYNFPNHTKKKTHTAAAATTIPPSNQWYSFKCTISGIWWGFFFYNRTGNTACSICVDAMTIFIPFLLFQQQQQQQ